MNEISIQLSPESPRPGSALDELVAALDSACEAMDEALGDLAGDLAAELAGELITAAIQRACLQPQLLSEAQRQGDLERYARHLLHADPAGRYALVALVWGPGQHSPVHAHHTWCGYGVVEGRLRNESYAYRDDVAQARWVDAVDCSPGAACFTQAGLQGIHRLGNASTMRAVSIHVYGVEAARVGCEVNRIVPVVGGVSSVSG